MDKHLFADIPTKAFIRKGEKFVLVEQAEGRPGWGLPGGRIDNGEQPREALVREIAEELGAHIQVGELVDCVVFTSTPSGVNHCVIAFEATLTDPDEEFVPDPGEIKDWRWVTLDEALKMTLRDEYRVIFERLAK